MKKIRFLLLLFISAMMLATCSSPAEKAEAALRSFYLSQNGIELDQCQLINVGDNTYEGLITYSLSKEEVEALKSGYGEENEFYEALMMLYGPFLDQMVDEPLEYQVRVLYDGRTIALTGSEMTNDCEQRLKSKMVGELFDLFR